MKPTKLSTIEFPSLLFKIIFSVILFTGFMGLSPVFGDPPETSTISFDVAGGTPAIAPMTLDEGSPVTPPADPTKAGFTFMGWSPDIPTIMPVDDIICVAQWEAIPPETSTITFDTDGGSAIAPITQEEGTLVSAPGDPTKAGFTFMGWVPPVPGTMPVDDITCVAQWEAIPPETSTITFDTDGGSAIAPITQEEGTLVSAPGDPTKAGFTFAGWVPPVPGTMPVNDLTCVAQWAVNSTTPQYYNYNTNGSNNSFPFGLAAGKEVQLLYLPGDFAQPVAAPPGNISILWLRIGDTYPINSWTYSDLTIKMGQSAITSFDPGDFYNVSLTTVYYRAAAVLSAAGGSWLAITLDTPFAYDPSQSLIIDIGHCGSSGATGFPSCFTNAPTGIRRNWSVGGCPFNYSGQNSSMYHIGLNVDPSCTQPIAYAVTGSGSYCEGTGGLPVGVANSESGVNYTITPGGEVEPGTGSAISFGNRLEGTYTVTGTKDGCSIAMTGSAVISAVKWYIDSDNDGFGNPAVFLSDCSQPGGYVADNTDCDDSDPAIKPGANELCDGKDNDCDGDIDEGVKTTYYLDSDGDTYGDPSNTTQACSPPAGYVSNNLDCDDNEPLEHPGQLWYTDADNDGYSLAGATTACLRPANGKAASELSALTVDCDDVNPLINPGVPEIPNNSIDDNCDGVIDCGQYITIAGGDFDDPASWAGGCIPPNPIPDGLTVTINHSIINPLGSTLTNNGVIDLGSGGIFTNYGTYQGTGTFIGNFINLGTVKPGN